MISYCIPVCNESVELKRLLNQLMLNLKDGDEIIIQGDQGNVTDDVISVVSSYVRNKSIVYIEYPLHSDFATFKNNFLKYVKNTWIFQIDADEMLSETFIENIHWLVENNPSIDSFAIPRVNIVQGLTQEWVDKWGWRVTNGSLSQDDKPTINVLSKCGVSTIGSTLELVNFPDYQCRLFRTDKKLHWVGKVHEVLAVGEENYINKPAYFPYFSNNREVYECCIFHVKDIERQIKQNGLYEKINP